MKSIKEVRKIATHAESLTQKIDEVRNAILILEENPKASRVIVSDRNSSFVITGEINQAHFLDPLYNVMRVYQAELSILESTFDGVLDALKKVGVAE